MYDPRQTIYTKAEYDRLRDKDVKLRKGIQDVLDMIRNEGRVSKWKIENWLERTLKGGDR